MERERHVQDTATGMAGILSAFAFANDLAFGLAEDDSIRSAYLAVRIAERMELPPAEQRTVYYAALVKDAGCTSWTSALASFWEANEIVARRELFIFGGAESLPSFVRWLTRYVGTDLPLHQRVARSFGVARQQQRIAREAFEGTRDVAMRIAARLGMDQPVQAAVSSAFEQWDGKGMPDGLSGDAIPLAARVVHPTFTLAPVAGRYGRDEALALARRQRGRAWDPDVTDAVLSLAGDRDFWETFEGSDVLGRLVALEPRERRAELSEARLDDVVLALADFADLKVPSVLAHSRRVALISEAIAKHLGMEGVEVRDVRRAALVHDLGLVAVPSRTLERAAPLLTSAEREQMRLHPYHGERILLRVPALASLAPVVGGHHERVDGLGYYRGLAGPQVPRAAQIVGLASRFDEAMRGHEHPAEIGPALAALDDGEHDPEVLAALRAVAGVRAEPERREWPAGLTDREVEVLRLSARGFTRRQVADRLDLSEHTVRHHLEHIYGKVGVTNRVAAALFAMESGLLD